MNNTKTTYRLTGLIFALTALFTVAAMSHNRGMAAVWLALSAVFIALSFKAESQ